jgi:membrane fusion protein (multidrug efflux system)
VAVVGSDNKVSMRTVKVGPRVGSLWVIESGLQAGEKVVSGGLQRLREGVTVHATPAPTTPDDSGAEPTSASGG